MRSRFECGLRDAKFSRISRLRGWPNPIASRNRARDFQSRTSKTYWLWRGTKGGATKRGGRGPPPPPTPTNAWAPHRRGGGLPPLARGWIHVVRGGEGRAAGSAFILPPPV